MFGTAAVFTALASFIGLFTLVIGATALVVLVAGVVVILLALNEFDTVVG